MTNKTFTKETLRKAARTFLQSAIGCIVANIAFVDFAGSKEVIRSALIGLAVSAISAGVAAVMNLEEVTDIIDNTESEVE